MRVSWPPWPIASATTSATPSSSSTISTRAAIGAGAAGAAVPAATGGGVTTGSSTPNVVPRPGTLSTVMVPPCSSMMLRHSDRPSPVPSPAGFVVKNGSKMRERISGGMPRPVSAISTRTRPPAWRARMVMRLGPGCRRMA